MQKMEAAVPSATTTRGAAESRKSFAERRLLVERMPSLPGLTVEMKNFVYSPPPKTEDERRAYEEMAELLRAKVGQLSSSRMKLVAEFLARIE